jgi:flagellin
LNNLNAIYAENSLNNTSNSLSTVLNQLSSGSKINSGADDAAGLSLVDGLQANQMALTQSKTNAAEGVGLLTVADGALSQVTNLLNRAVTLATEASNGTLNSSQDTAANQEYQSILSEVSNIGSTTTYNQEQVFGSSTNIYTGDSSTVSASVDSLNIRSLSSSNLGDTDGQMVYATGSHSSSTSNVFLNLSSSSVNASSSDTLNGGLNGSTSLTVNYLNSGGVASTATINTGGTSGFANTAAGMVSAINSAGLGLSANFTTQAQAGVTGGGSQTGIEISGGLISAGIDPSSSSTSGTLNLSGLKAGATLALGSTVTIKDGSTTYSAITINSTNNTLTNLAGQISGNTSGAVTANVITNGDGTQSLAFSDASNTGGTLSVTTTAGTAQAPTFGTGSTGQAVAIQTGGGSGTTGTATVTGQASTINMGTGATGELGTDVLTAGSSIVLTNAVSPGVTETATFVVGVGTDTNNSANNNTFYTGSTAARTFGNTDSTEDTLQGLANAINANNSTLGVTAAVGVNGLTLTTGTWSGTSSGSATAVALGGENVGIAASTLTTANAATAVAVSTAQTASVTTASVGTHAVTALDFGSAAGAQADTLTGNLVVSNLNGTTTFAVGSGTNGNGTYYLGNSGDNTSSLENLETVINAHSAALGYNVASTTALSTLTNGDKGLVLTSNSIGADTIAITGSTMKDSTHGNVTVASGAIAGTNSVTVIDDGATGADTAASLVNGSLTIKSNSGVTYTFNADAAVGTSDTATTFNVKNYSTTGTSTYTALAKAINATSGITGISASLSAHGLGGTGTGEQLELTSTTADLNPITIGGTLQGDGGTLGMVVDATATPATNGSGANGAGTNTTYVNTTTTTLQLAGLAGAGAALTDATASLSGAITLASSLTGNSQLFIMGADPGGQSHVANAIYTGGNSVASLDSAINSTTATLGISAAPGTGGTGIVLTAASGTITTTFGSGGAANTTALSAVSTLTPGHDGTTLATSGPVAGSSAVTAVTGVAASDSLTAKIVGGANNGNATGVSTSDQITGSFTVVNSGTATAVQKDTGGLTHTGDGSSAQVTVIDTGAATAEGNQLVAGGTFNISLAGGGSLGAYTTQAGDTWDTLISKINNSTAIGSAVASGVTASWNANAGGTGIGGIVLTGNAVGANAVTATLTNLKSEAADTFTVGSGSAVNTTYVASSAATLTSMASAINAQSLASVVSDTSATAVQTGSGSQVQKSVLDTGTANIEGDHLLGGTSATIALADGASYTYTAATGDTWQNVISDINSSAIGSGDATGVTASWSANAGGTGVGGILLTGKTDLANAVTLSGNLQSEITGGLNVYAVANSSGLTFTQTSANGGTVSVASGSNTLTDVTEGTYSKASSSELASESDNVSGALVFNVGGGSEKTVTASQVATAYSEATSAVTAKQLVSYIHSNASTLGVDASWQASSGNTSFGSIVLTSETEGASGTVNVSGANGAPNGLTSLVDTTSGAALTYSAGNAYNTGLSGSVTDTTTSASGSMTTQQGSSTSLTQPSSTAATISYTDQAGVSLAATNLTTQTSAESALNYLNAAITAVAAQDGYIGAQINTLNSVSNVLSTQSENVTAAQNAVQATDYASATSNMSKYQILSQTGISALAQANSMQQEVTKLLQ